MWIKRFFAAFLVFVPALVYAYGNTMLALVIPPPPKVVTGGSITDRPDLVAYYTFETDLGDESGGSDDLSPGGDAARSAADPITGTGSLLLDGTGDYASRDDGDLASDFPLKNGTTNKIFTVCAQFNLDAATQETIVSKSDDSGKESLLLLVLNNDVRVLHGYSGGAYFESATQDSNISTGSDYSVCYAEDGASPPNYRLSVYDHTAGALVTPDVTGTWANSINIGSGAFSIGAQQNGAGWAKDADGQIDNVAIFNTALSSEDMLQYFTESWEEGFAGCEPNYADAFGSDSITAGDWVEYSGDWSVSGGALVPPDSGNTNMLIYQPEMDTVVHGASVELSDATEDTGVILRSSADGSGYKYVVRYDESAGAFKWEIYNGTTLVSLVQSNGATMADGENFVASIDDSYVVRIWIDSISRCPHEGSVYTIDKDGDGDGDQPDILFANSPSIAVNGLHVGVFSGGTATRTYDNFAAFYLGERPVLSEVYYLSTTGAGANSGDTNAWNTPALLEANAMSASNFNTSANWSDAPGTANKIDPADIVQVTGSGWNSSSYALTPVYGVTLDGWDDSAKGGAFDPSNATHQATSPILYEQSRIYVLKDDVTIRDMRFDKYTGTNVRVGVTSATRFCGYKISGFRFTNNYSYCDGDQTESGTGLVVSFIVDSEIDNNTFYATNVGGYQNYKYRKPLAIQGGSRNKIHDNDITGYIVSMYIQQPRILYYSKVPSSGSYNYDPEYNWSYNEIYNNVINRWPYDQEGYSLDNSDASDSIGTYERDTIAPGGVSVDGLTITLSNSGYATAPGGAKDYSGLIAANVSDDPDKFGKFSIISAMSGSVLTLENTIAAEAGDTINIGSAHFRNWIHDNQTDPDGEDRGYTASTFLLEGMAFENLWEDNIAHLHDNSTPAGGMKIANHYGWYRALDYTYDWNMSVTKTYSYAATAYNIITGNTFSQFQMNTILSAHSGATNQYSVPSYNNAFINNTFTETTGDGGGYSIKGSYVWIPVAERTDVREIVDSDEGVDSGYLSSDPTTDVATWFSGWVSGGDPPDPP